MALKNADYLFVTVSEYLSNTRSENIVIFRHDVEKRYKNALRMAEIEHSQGIMGTFYFRFSKRHFQGDIVKEIAKLGHEVGYHYDDLSKCHGNFEKAMNRFRGNLRLLRNMAPVTTICMDGSPLSKYDNRNLWDKYNYR